MRRKLALLVTVTGLALGGGIAGAATADAQPSPKSVHTFCVGGVNEHPGNHNGWSKNGSLERRNLGGTCPAQP